jgi:hypothetical protein
MRTPPLARRAHLNASAGLISLPPFFFTCVISAAARERASRGGAQQQNTNSIQPLTMATWSGRVALGIDQITCELYLCPLGARCALEALARV